MPWNRAATLKKCNTGSGDAFLAAKRGDAVLAAKALQRDGYLVLGGKRPTRLVPRVFHDCFDRGFGRRIFGGGFELLVRSFVATAKPEPSSIYNPNVYHRR